MRQNFRGAFFGLLLCLVSASSGWTQNGGAWQLGAPMPLSRQELASGVLDGKLYVIGGYDLNRSSTPTVRVYNPTTNTWALARPLPFPVNHNAAAVAGGKLYSFGSAGGETFVYDPNSNSWVRRASSHFGTAELLRSE